MLGIPPTLARARIPIFFGKEGFGVQKPPFPLGLEEGVFRPKTPFFYKGTQEKGGFFDRKLSFPARARARGNGRVWTPKPSFPGNGGSGLGSGESQPNAVSCDKILLRATAITTWRVLLFWQRDGHSGGLIKGDILKGGGP